jgi:hypothetical protein
MLRLCARKSTPQQRMWLNDCCISGGNTQAERPRFQEDEIGKIRADEHGVGLRYRVFCLQVVQLDCDMPWLAIPHTVRSTIHRLVW